MVMTVEAEQKKRLMFLCTGNSCRSQMVEGFARALGGREWEVYSAGFAPKGVHPMAIEVMREVGVDMAHQTSKLLEPALLAKMDYVITLCRKRMRPVLSHLHRLPAFTGLLKIRRAPPGLPKRFDRSSFDKCAAKSAAE